jgi:hypothetical protein
MKTSKVIELVCNGRYIAEVDVSLIERASGRPISPWTMPRNSTRCASLCGGAT